MCPPVFLAGFSIQGHHAALAVGNEHPVVIDDRHQIDELFVDADANRSAPELFQAYRIGNLDQLSEAEIDEALDRLSVDGPEESR